MLKKIHIANHIEMHSDEWHQGRLGRFTASEIHNLMGEKEFTQGALSYIYRKVGEELSGLPYRDEIDTEATRHGLLYEAEAVKEFGVKKGVDMVIVQKLITAPDSRFGCTPDFILPVKESECKTMWQVQTGEVKCPMNYSKYIELFLCKTPQQVKAVNKAYYWQVLDQMDNCDSLMGYFIVYQPFFRAGKMNIVEFKKIDLVDEFRLLKVRKQSALKKFEEIRELLLNAA